MSFLGKALAVVGAIVGIAAAVASGGTLAIIAAGLLTVNAAVQLGVVGGAVGKFMNSGLGRGLLLATSLGSAYSSMAQYGATAGGAGATQAAGTTVTDMNGAGVLQNGLTAGEAADGQVAALTNSSFLNSVGAGHEVAGLAADPAMQIASGVAPQSLASINAAAPEAGGIAPGMPGAVGNPIGAQGSQAAAGATQADVNAVKPLDSAMGGSPAVGKPVMAGQESGATPAGAGTPPAAPGVGGPNTNAAGGYDVPDSGPPASGAGGGGWMSKAADIMNSKGGSALIQGGGNMLGGIGQGISQKQAMEDQIKAMQWGNMQWQNQGQVDKMQAAAAQPITVPQGYLQRAQQTRSLMQGNAGMQPLPAASPGAPLAPSPVHV